MLMAFACQISNAQQTVHFYGGKISQYTSPMKASRNDKYHAYYTNSDFTEQGRITLNATNKTFIIKWLTGEERTLKYSKIETKHDAAIGENILCYIGKWTDDNSQAECHVMKYANGCVITVYTGRVVDEEYDINDWKAFFTFITSECFNAKPDDGYDESGLHPKHTTPPIPKH